MRPEALQQAKDRVARAEAALDRMRQATDFQVIESAWTDLLVAANTVYSKLEQGAKGNGKSEGWFGRKKHDRKTDPLLRYVHQARNADEHGIEPVTVRQPGHVGIGTHGPGAITLNGTVGPNGYMDLRVSSPTGSRIRVEFNPAQVRLVAVRNSIFDDVFEPPTQHLGKPIEPSLLQVAIFTVNYLHRLIAEAGELASV